MSSQPAVTNQAQTSNTTRAPLGGAQGNLFGDIWGDTSGALKTAQSTPMPTSFVAGPTGAQQQGAGLMLDVAPTLGGAAGDTTNLTKKIASGYFTDPTSDPHFQNSVTSALLPGFRSLTQGALPAVQDISLRASGGGTGPAAYGGRGGGSPQDMLTERVLQDWGQTASATGANMANTARGQGFNLMSLIPGLAQSGTSQALAPASVTEAAGGLQQGFNQQSINDIIQKYLFQTQQPFQQLGAAANIGGTGGFGTGTGTANTTTTGPVPSLATQWLQGITGGAGATNALFGSGPQGSPSAISNIGSGIGSAVSGMTGWLSSLGVPAEIAAVLPAAAAL